jgi:Ca-activated chloride channel family protein
MMKVPSTGNIILFGLTLPAQVAQRPDAGHLPRIFVVAVHDSFLFTMCPSSRQQATGNPLPSRAGTQAIRSPDGTLLILPMQVHPQLGPTSQRMRPDWLDLPGTTPGLCPSGWTDTDLRRYLEKELSNQKGYVLADSLENADLVLLVEGLYIPAPRQAGRGNGRARGGPPALMLAVASAIVVAADIYRRNPVDSETLLKAERWEGAEAYRYSPAARGEQPKLVPVSLRRLVAQFVDSKHQTSRLASLYPVYPSPSSLHHDPAPRASGAVERSRPVTAADRVFRVDVELVTVPVIARTAQGRYVPDLTEGDFHVFENDIEQKVDRVVPEDAPFDVALLLDLSNSTRFQHEDIRNAALAFVEALRPADRVMIVSFSSSIDLDSELTGDRNQLRRVITHTHVVGKTRLCDAVDLVITERLSRLQGRKAIVLFTDGIDTQSWMASAAGSLARVQESDVLVYVIRYDTKPPDVSRQAIARAAEYLRDLSDYSGGRLFIASTIRSLRGAFAQIADEWRHQYALCYYPREQTADGSLRVLRVTVDRPDVRIRARTGYRASPVPAK